MHRRKLHVYKLRYVRDILNQARNLNRTSLAKEKQKKNIQTNNQQQQQTKTNKNKQKQKHIISSNNSSDNKDQNISRQLLLLCLTLLLLLDCYVLYIWSLNRTYIIWLTRDQVGLIKWLSETLWIPWPSMEITHPIRNNNITIWNFIQCSH